MSDYNVGEKFGEKLRTLRTRRGMTLQEIADMAGYSTHSLISGIETGKVNATDKFIDKVAEIFDISLEVLLDDSIELEFERDTTMTVYFAAPLFSIAERRFNQGLTDHLEKAGFEVFLPQRDGIEQDAKPYRSMKMEALQAAIFERDKQHILQADVFLMVLDGRVPDEGACVELGMAYCQKLLDKPDKLIIGLRTDERAAFVDAPLNAMVQVPFDFITDDETTLVNVLRYYRSTGLLN